MKRTLVCLAATSLFALGSFAQTSGSSATTSGTQTTTKTTSKASKKSGAAKEKTLTGCVAAGDEANEYVLEHGKRKVELVTTEDLKPHLGHTVKVTGNWTSEEKEKQEMGGGAEKGEHKEAGERHFKVDKLDMVSDTCTATKASTKVKK
jgi:hypothetical protein